MTNSIHPVASCDTCTAPAVSFGLNSTTTLMGNRSHTIETKDNAFALSLFEQALDLDIEPEFALRRGFYIIEFIATDADALAAIQTAQRGFTA